LVILKITPYAKAVTIFYIRTAHRDVMVDAHLKITA